MISARPCPSEPWRRTLLCAGAAGLGPGPHPTSLPLWLTANECKEWGKQLSGLKSNLIHHTKGRTGNWPIFHLNRYQAIREVVIEGQNEITVSTSSTRTVVSNGDTGLNNTSSLEAHQNAINLSQESLKKKVTIKYLYFFCNWSLTSALLYFRKLQRLQTKRLVAQQDSQRNHLLTVDHLRRKNPPKTRPRFRSPPKMKHWWWLPVHLSLKPEARALRPQMDHRSSRMNHTWRLKLRLRPVLKQEDCTKMRWVETTILIILFSWSSTATLVIGGSEYHFSLDFLYGMSLFI